MAAHQIARRGLVRTFQKETAFASLTVRQNLQVAAKYGAKLTATAASSAIDDVAERFSLQPRMHAMAGSLTVFETKRLMIATALILRPKIILLDEPASGLTSEEVEEARALITRLGQEGIAILLIEHILPLLFGVSKRVLVMDFGRKLTEGSPEEIARDPRVIEAYLGGQDEAEG
jgi:branched-chain amino acid transport system ATP-binding protein